MNKQQKQKKTSSQNYKLSEIKVAFFRAVYLNLTPDETWTLMKDILKNK